MDELNSFTSEMDGWIDGVLERLNWTREGLLQTEDKRECSVNSAHVMGSSVLMTHQQNCSIKTQGYTKDDLKKDQSSKFFYENAPAVLTIELDDETMGNILKAAGGPLPDELPMTMERTITSLTIQQRLKIYEYCVEVSRKSGLLNQITDEDLMLIDAFSQSKEDEPQSKLEFLAKMRDLKRRRQSYKGKNTHTGKKNHTEVIRDVLANQMEVLSKIWEEEEHEKQILKRRQEREKKEKLNLDDKSNISHTTNPSQCDADSRSHERRRSHDRQRSRDRQQSHEKHRSRKRRRSIERRKSKDKEDRRKSKDKEDRRKSKDKEDRRKSKDKEDRRKSKDKEDRRKSKDREDNRESQPSSEKQQIEDQEQSQEKQSSKDRHKAKKRHRSKNHGGRSDSESKRHKHKKHKRSKETTDGENGEKQSKCKNEEDVIDDKTTEGKLCEIEQDVTSKDV